MVQHLGNLEKLISILAVVVVGDWDALVLFDAILFVPLFDLLFLDASLIQFHLRLNTEHGVDICLLNNLFDIGLVQRVGTQNNILELATFMNWVEEEAFKESAICLLDDAVDNVHIILDLPVACGRYFFITNLTLIHLWISQQDLPFWLPLADLLMSLTKSALHIGVIEIDLLVVEILSLAVSIHVPHTHLALPQLDWATILRRQPLACRRQPLHPYCFHPRRFARKHYHFVAWLI